MPVQFQTKKQRPFLNFGNFFPADVVALVSDRSIDFARGNAQDDAQQKRREFFGEYLGMDPNELADIKQVHGKDVVLVSQRGKITKGPVEADGLITKEPGIALAVRTADCLSVFIFDPKSKAIGVIHAGWRGTQLKIAVAAVKMMMKEFGAKPEDLKVAFGPCIRSCCYQVGTEFSQHFPQETIRKGDELYFDLPLANKRQLLNLGVRISHVFDCALCTCCDERFFSFRREKDKAGRMISIMMLK